MRAIAGWMGVGGMALGCGLMAAHFASAQEAAPGGHGQGKDRARVVISQALPKIDGEHLKAVLVEVNYGPGEASPPHSHPCAVLGYVVAGRLRTQVKGEPEMTYKAGESFYEAPNGVHLVSANASSTEPAKLVAYMLCGDDRPLSVDVRANASLKGGSR